MRFSSTFAGAALALAGSSNGLNILMNNDDGFGSANLRELYKMLKDAGHNVYVVAPATGQSAQGGRSVFTDEATLTGPSQYDLIPAGSPSIGQDPYDSHIWYYNGTPAATTFMALDYVLPNFADFDVPDLVVTGPNYGTNLGPFVWTLSGTAGAAYAATSRSLPAVALSASNKASVYTDVKGNKSHPAYIAAAVSFKVVQGIIDAAPKSTPRKPVPVLPLGYGINVNIPPLFEHNYTDIKTIQTRFTGGAETNQAVPNPDKPGTFTWSNLRPLSAGVNRCLNGDCKLTGETLAVNDLGVVSLSLYIVDYDAPTRVDTKAVSDRLLKTGVTSNGKGKGKGGYKKRFEA